ncbi:glycosyltransferase [Gottfriedia acidiceleris]|uniref:glycosyltransferase n=1 Tax=Gottfriedia acidiceleris TaxID=371036 RepID=UPI00101BA41C|nr:glycosyltransferase [Gottfriedia acidiceleris]
MNVLHINSSFSTGGAEKLIKLFITENNDQYNNYLCIVNDIVDSDMINGLADERILFCKRQEGSKNIFNNFRIFFKILRFIRLNKISILHCHNTFSLKVALLIKKMIKIKVIYTIHANGIINEKYSMLQVDTYVAISKTVYNNAIAVLKNKKLVLINNAVNLKPFLEINSSKIPKSDKKYKIVCLARINPVKGQDILIKSLRQLIDKYNFNNFHCYFAGETMDKVYEKKLDDTVSELGLKDCVTFLGNVSDVYSLYKECDLLVLPSRNEGFGLVLLEALAAGCNVIASNIEAPSEIILNYPIKKQVSTFETENFMDLSEKIYYFTRFDRYSNYTNKEIISTYLEENYSLDSFFKQYNLEYDHLMKS